MFLKFITVTISILLTKTSDESTEKLYTEKRRTYKQHQFHGMKIFAIF